MGQRAGFPQGRVEVRGRSLNLPEGMGVGGQRPGFPRGLEVERRERRLASSRAGLGGRGLALPGGMRVEGGGGEAWIPTGWWKCMQGRAENEVLLFALQSKPELPGTGPGDHQV